MGEAAFGPTGGPFINLLSTLPNGSVKRRSQLKRLRRK
jgi:hypothetical protein